MTNLFLAAQGAGAQGGGMSMILMMVAIFAIMWFFMIRPQQKRQKEIQNELQRGTQVVTGGGIYGTVKSIDLAKNTVEVEIARDVVITVDKGFVYKDTTSTTLQK